MNIIIENINFSAYFQRDPDIRKKLFHIENIFSPKFIKPFQLIQVPDDAPEEIPRIQAQSNMGHSQLVISQSNISILTNFDNGWETNWDQCKNYFLGNIDLSFKSLKAIENKSISYCGIVANLFIELDEPENTIGFLKNLFLKNVAADNLYDLNLKFTYEHEDKYYINYTFSNHTKYQPTDHSLRLVPAYLKKIKTGILLNIDINDRFAYNFLQGYVSNESEGSKLVTILTDIIHNRLNNILSGGLL